MKTDGILIVLDTFCENPRHFKVQGYLSNKDKQVMKATLILNGLSPVSCMIHNWFETKRIDEATRNKLLIKAFDMQDELDTQVSLETLEKLKAEWDRRLTLDSDLDRALEAFIYMEKVAWSVMTDAERSWWGKYDLDVQMKELSNISYNRLRNVEAIDMASRKVLKQEATETIDPEAYDYSCYLTLIIRLIRLQKQFNNENHQTLAATPEEKEFFED